MFLTSSSPTIGKKKDVLELLQVALYLISDHLISCILNKLMDEVNIAAVFTLFLNTYGLDHHGTQYMLNALFQWYALTSKQSIELVQGSSNYRSRKLYINIYGITDVNGIVFGLRTLMG